VSSDKISLGLGISQLYFSSRKFVPREVKIFKLDFN